MPKVEQMPSPLSSVLVLGFAVSTQVVAGIDEDLAAAAKTPYDIGHFVDTHADFEWAPLWKALGIKELSDKGDGVFLPPCDDRFKCSEELITVLDPFQVIVLLRSEEYYRGDVYLRFIRPGGPERPGPWNLTGYYSNGGAGLRPEARADPLRNEAVSLDYWRRALRLNP
jgi:hypothetical protein